MKSIRYTLTQASLLFTAGAVGGITETLLVWLSGKAGIPAALGVNLAPELSTAWLYSTTVWGGLWGFLFFLPFFRRACVLRGFVYSLVPAGIQLFILFPKSGAGIMGLNLGALTPVLIVLYIAVWGITASYWVKIVAGNKK